MNLKKYIFFVLPLILFSCEEDDGKIDFPVIYPEMLVRGEFLLQQYPDLEGFYIIDNNLDVETLEELSNGDIYLSEKINDFDFSEKIIIGAIGESKVEQTKIMFAPVLETDVIEVQYYELENWVHSTSGEVQSYLFMTLDKTDKSITFKPTNN